ncbi:longitudinals lacking protein, isoforms A/B/D/L isoform X5 [Condylostylus longicornis]|uniref:longitudinals lacking protein, isoforms A/B/D/L isoform X5 n=1 Tax=Condylostylus longicornis TaxID=2530218 RepID=UPI00244D9DC2|nr:longitudinals lacking protein, isoforms A/B/D/L isoform X5 [Condylostylus longicornis]
MEDDQQFCLRWNNHQNTLISNFDKLLENGTLVDCTLAAEGQFLKAHKVVLSACSPYFANLLKEQYDKHPIFILKDVKYQELRAMMDYMYRGEVNISQDQLAALLKAAESLQIKGLSDRPQRSTDQHPNINVPGRMQHPHGGGYTLEQTKRPRLGPVIDTPDMREGSSSPTSRKRKKLRRRSIENVMDNHEHSNSSAHSTQPINTSTPSITSGTAAIVATSQQQQQQSQQSLQQSSVSQQQQQQGNIVGTKKTENVSNIKQTAGSSDDVLLAEQDNQMEQEKQIKKDQNKQQRKSGHDKDELLIEPKNEYEEVNEPIEDLTEDPEELMDEEDLDNQAGPSHHGGEGSSQGFPQWPADRSQDEFIMTAQDQGQQRDPQVHKHDANKYVDMKYNFEQTMHINKYSDYNNESTQEQMCNTNINQTLLNNASNVIMTPDGQRFPCSVCGKSYLRKRHLQRHMRDECIGIPPRFKCDLCPSRFRRKYHMVRHMNSKHGIPPPLTSQNSSLNNNSSTNNISINANNGSCSDNELKPQNLCIKKEKISYEADNISASKVSGICNTTLSGGTAVAAAAVAANSSNIHNKVNIIPAHMDRVVQASVLAAMNAAAVAVGVPNLSNSPHHRSNGVFNASDQRTLGSCPSIINTDISNENQCGDENRAIGNGAGDAGVNGGLDRVELNQQLLHQSYFDDRDSKDNLRDIKAVINDDDWKMKLSLQLISNSLLKERLVNAMPFSYNNN